MYKSLSLHERTDFSNLWWLDLVDDPNGKDRVHLFNLSIHQKGNGDLQSDFLVEYFPSNYSLFRIYKQV